MQGELVNIDSGILQFTPKGAYYEGKLEQYQAVVKMWMDLFNYDRTLFGLLMLLNGTGYSKGAMAKILLSNPQEEVMLPGMEKDEYKLPAQLDGLPAEFENEVIRYALYKEKTPRALKNLLMFVDETPRVNNSRTRNLILEYIFKRDNKSLEYLAINYKSKLQKLIRHALGKQDLAKLLAGNNQVFRKFVGKYNEYAMPVVRHIFNQYETAEKKVYFPLLDVYSDLKRAAETGDVDAFRKSMTGMPITTVMGFRNLYKVPIDKKEIYKTTKLSTKQKIQMQAASKKAGAKVDVDYEKQDIYDLFKFLYFKSMEGTEENVDDIIKIVDAIEVVQTKIPKIDVGKCVVIMDASHSMMGSDERPLHPFLTGLSIISTLENVQEVIYVGGHQIEIKSGDAQLPVPHNGTDLWRGLIKAVETKVENIIVISDGYENSVKGMFEHVYNNFKNSGYNFKLMHINPVFAASSSNGTGRKLVDGIKPLPVGDHKFLETEVIFSKLIEDTGMVKKLLINKYRNLLK